MTTEETRIAYAVGTLVVMMVVAFITRLIVTRVRDAKVAKGASGKPTASSATAKSGWGWTVVVTLGLMLVASLLTWWLTSNHEREIAAKQVAAVKTVHQQEKWLFWQILHGQRLPVVEIKVTKDENGQFNFVLTRTGGGEIQISAGFQLQRMEGQMIGNWVNYEHMEDHGEVVLHQARQSNIWTGEYMSPRYGGKVVFGIEKVNG